MSGQPQRADPGEKFLSAVFLASWKNCEWHFIVSEETRVAY